MNQKNQLHNDDFSIAVDEVLLKLSKQYGIALPKDDYLLVHLFLNKEIIIQALDDKLEQVKSENDRSKTFFRESLITLIKQFNEREKEKETQIKRLITVSTISLIIAMLSMVIVFFIK